LVTINYEAKRGRVAAHLKRWFLETYHGGMKTTEVQPYLDEFVIRYNRRTSKSRGLVFHRMVEAAVNSKPLAKLPASSA